MSLNIHNTTLCVNLIFTKFTVVSRFLVTPLTSDTNRLRASKASILAVDEVQTGVEMFRQVWRCSETCGDVQTGVGCSDRCGDVRRGVGMFRQVWGCSERCGDVQTGVVMFRQVW
jgi:hypothetical protein